MKHKLMHIQPSNGQQMRLRILKQIEYMDKWSNLLQEKVKMERKNNLHGIIIMCSKYKKLTHDKFITEGLQLWYATTDVDFKG